MQTNILLPFQFFPLLPMPYKIDFQLLFISTSVLSKIPHKCLNDFTSFKSCTSKT